MQNGSGWILLVLALLIAAAGYRVSQSHADKWWLPLIFCAVAAVLVIWMGNDKDLRTLYPVGLNGTVDTSQPGIVANLGIAIYTSQPGIVANLGIAIYLAGVGVAAAAIGSLMFRQNTPRTRTVGDDER